MFDEPGRDERRGWLDFVLLPVSVCNRIVGPPLLGLLIADDLESPLLEQHGVYDKTYMPPITADDNKNPVFLRVLVVGVLARYGTGIFDERAERFARAVAPDDEDFAGLALMDFLLHRRRGVQPQRLQLPLPNLRLESLDFVLLILRQGRLPRRNHRHALW